MWFISLRFYHSLKSFLCSGASRKPKQKKWYKQIIIKWYNNFIKWNYCTSQSEHIEERNEKKKVGAHTNENSLAIYSLMGVCYGLFKWIGHMCVCVCIHWMENISFSDGRCRAIETPLTEEWRSCNGCVHAANISLWLLNEKKKKNTEYEIWIDMIEYRAQRKIPSNRPRPCVLCIFQVFFFFAHCFFCADHFFARFFLSAAQFFNYNLFFSVSAKSCSFSKLWLFWTCNSYV